VVYTLQRNQAQQTQSQPISLAGNYGRIGVNLT
jgi:hypothetical protein